ncbi:hypothetical protein SLS55_006468 [Diplodia seriata]|uniref:Uncharacterized protein n=1 Tax=Diplodia seriata TaxID=420778 RepID=A0A1S8BDU0_9PEZI|nr:hypothetical protein BK809_0004212 [Diplodia seriata]
MRYQFLASALAAQLALTAAMPQPDQTVYETEVDTITSCGPEVTNCPARSHPATAAPSGPAATTAAVPSESAPAYGVPSAPAESAPSAPAYGVPSAPAESAPGSSAPAPSAPASSGVEGSHPSASAPGSSGPAPSAPAPSAPASSAVEGGQPPAGPATVFTTNVQTITSCGPEVTNCPASSHPATAVGSAPAPSGTASGGQTCEEQENMCRTKPGANMAQCSADRASCDGYIPGQGSGTATAPAASGTPSGGQTCEEQENMCRTQPGANMAQCSADRASCDGYIPGGSVPGYGTPNTPSNATASFATPTPAQPTPSQWTGAASTSFVSFGVMAFAAAAAAFVL